MGITCTSPCARHSCEALSFLRSLAVLCSASLLATPVCNFHGLIILKVKVIYLADLLRLPIFVMLLKDVMKR